MSKGPRVKSNSDREIDKSDGEAMEAREGRNRVYQIDQRVNGGLRTVTSHKESMGPKIGNVYGVTNWTKGHL